ncbi:NF-X1-type zinc finger protein NFXL1-like [Rhopilema esculentum]|uniref:NF-X1-type zinc finger protein NFXL1-like n=1 Tax=Rhopilema esculentum TaxID=499914 RepID=UPI0031DD614D
MNQKPNGFGRGRGQGRGRAAPAVDGNRSFDLWNSKAAMKTAKQESKNSSRPSLNSSGVAKSTSNKQEEWGDRKTGKQEAKNSSKPSFNSSGVAKSTFNKEEEWRDRETASEGRLEKARKIRKVAAEKYSHLLEDTDSSDEELREEEIMKKTLNNYTVQLCGDDSSVPEPNSFVANMLQAGEITCPVCIDPVKHVDPIWSCRKCFGIFHIQCIQRWARQLVGAKNIEMENSELEESTLWCCPNCRNDYKQEDCPTKYFCFCGKEANPKFDPWTIPHSCGQKCAKMLTPICGHECLLLCHPGPCPPCPKTVSKKCHCGRGGPSTRRCCNKEWSCGAMCSDLLACGLHKCKSTCHPGDCPPCPEKSLQPCKCSKHKQLRDCAAGIWKCSEVCGKVLSCGYHTCEEVCHNGTCGPCPRTGKRSCPCGKMSLQLPCTEDIPPCEDTCGKRLECGRHKCHWQCHTGQCETCRQIVTKTCRCGKCSKELPCCQLFTCDFKCTRMRNCQRHPCKRKCCDGDCPPCEQICNRQLSCRNHKCPSQCHTGLCFPCPLKKEVTCYCQFTKVSVNCGAERFTKPPKCKQACSIPSNCHHKTRESHRCHFNRCPSCRQTCGRRLESCIHTCPAACHDEVPVRNPNKPNFSLDQKPKEVFTFVQLPCPPCKVPMQRECFGKHEVSTFPCSEDKPFSCKRRCGRRLVCGNHHCERECHVVVNAPSDTEAGSDCLSCEKPCLKPRPTECTHSCSRPCHPGDCPPCVKYVRTSCHCGLIMMEIKCFALASKDGEEEEAAKSCQNRCPKSLECSHRCPKICHPGDCPKPETCSQKVKLFCSCRRIKKDQRCKDAQYGISSLECDDKCEEIRNEIKKEEEKKAAEMKAEELKKQQEEVECFERKMGGRKRKPKNTKIEDEKQILSRRTFFILIAIIVAFISVLAILLF